MQLNYFRLNRHLGEVASKARSRMRKFGVFLPDPLKYRKGQSDNGWMLDLAYSPGGKLLATASRDFTAQLFDVATEKRLAVFGQPGGFNTRAGIAFSPGGNVLVTTHDNVVMLWDTTSYQPLATLVNFTRRVHHVTFSPDGKLLATSSDDFTIQIWA